MPSMPEPPWRPASEAEAAGAPAVLLEWLRTVHGMALAGPAALAAWRCAEPAAFAAAMSAFACLDATTSVRDALLRGHGDRTALKLVDTAGVCRVWSRAELLLADPLPPPITHMLAALTQADLPALVASHLLDAGTAPDDRLVWAGDPAEPWPLGAWLVGATVVLADASVAGIRAAPRWRG